MLPTPYENRLEDFDWPVACGAERAMRHYVEAFLARNTKARELATRMANDTGTDFFEWVDHLTLDVPAETDLARIEFVVDPVPAPEGWAVWRHPRAMLPRVVVWHDGLRDGAPTRLAIRPESIVEFAAQHAPDAPITGRSGARHRLMVVSEENGHRLTAIERLADRGFLFAEAPPHFATAVQQVRELWRTRRREFADDADGVAHAFRLQSKAIQLVGRDVACDLFFAEERAYWESRNTAARIQKRRQDLLGLGWANHDHHTFRCSRARFADLIWFLLNFGFQKRERFYAGAEAGWGAQICEHAITGITVFADVDLMPDETGIDFSREPLPPVSKLGTVGLWCALHGDSLLQAGMHHLEARFNFSALRDQLERHGVRTMRPFSDFPFLKQAFTEGERWTVDSTRVERLRHQSLITADQAEIFHRDGAIGSHLENLQRKGGYKGFNQKSVSAIIAATDPRASGFP